MPPHRNDYLCAVQSIRQLLALVRHYPGAVVGNVVCNLFMVLFSILSLPALIPFLNLLFDRQPIVTEAPVAGLTFDTLEPWFNYHISQIILRDGKEQMLLYLCAGIVGLFFFKNLFRYGSLFFMAPFRNGIVRDLRQQLFDKMMRLPLAYYSEERKGDLLARATADVQEVEWSILNVLETLVRSPLMLIGTLVFMLLISPALTLFVFGLLIFTALVIGGIGRALKHQSGAVQERLGTLVSMLEEGIGGLRIIKGFGAERYQQERFRRENDTHRDLLTRVLWRRDLSSPLTEVLGIATVAALIYFGYYRIQVGELEVATFFAFLIAFYNLLEPAKKFSNASYNVRKGMAAVDRINAILRAPQPIRSPEQPVPVEASPRRIELRGVSFHYPGGEFPVLENIELTIERGRMIALVGPSGAGKSTLVDLLPRFYDPTEGEILLDGIPLGRFALDDLRSLFGIVSQEAILFNDSVYNNIAFGYALATPARVEAAARVANAHDFIAALPEGYQTRIGDRGMKLSGGQRQRLTIARAILRDPPVLLLDEATSALDTASERLVQTALDEVMRGRTSVVIAHRLSTVQHADLIVVLRDGRIVERGTHTELLERGALYRELVQLQGLH